MAVLTNAHMLNNIKNLREQNFKGMVAQPTVTGKELTSEKKEKPHGKKKKTRGKKNNLTAKEKRIKNVLSASKKFCCESFSFCCEVNSFAVTVVGHRTKGEENKKQLDSDDTQQSRTSVANI